MSKFTHCFQISASESMLFCLNDDVEMETVQWLEFKKWSKNRQIITIVNMTSALLIYNVFCFII